MADFVIVLQNKNQKTYRVISWLIIALNFFGLLYIGFTRSRGTIGLPYYAAGLLAAIYVFTFFTDNEEIVKDCLMLDFGISIIAWVVFKFYWVGLAMLVLFAIQEISRRKLVVELDTDGILYPSFPRREIEWQDVNNVVLKDGILTIDLKNDKLFQNEIVSPTPENDFNEFCSAQLKAAQAAPSL